MRGLKLEGKTIRQALSSQVDNKILLLYGAGFAGRNALGNMLHDKGLNIKLCKKIFFIDDDINKKGKKIFIEENNFEIKSLSEIFEIYDKEEVIVLITNFYVNETIEKLGKFEVDVNNVFFIEELLIEDMNLKLLKENEESMDKVYGMLSDSKSKLVYNSILEGKINKDARMMTYLMDKIQYFPDGLFEFSQNEVFVDAGAFDGDTAEMFVEKTKTKGYKKIYAFEPDNTNFKKLSQRKIDNLEIYNKGLYSDDATLSFTDNMGGSSKLDSNGEVKVNVVSLDKMHLENIPTFIKMDIEGSELEALKGAENIIKNNKPKLAICIYHKTEDLWEIPLYIKKLVPEYKLYIRNYTDNFGEVVLYANV